MVKGQIISHRQIEIQKNIGNCSACCILSLTAFINTNGYEIADETKAVYYCGNSCITEEIDRSTESDRSSYKDS